MTHQQLDQTDKTQIAPVMGLLGTIVGYLLGKETRENASGMGSSRKDTPGKTIKELHDGGNIN
ncbi:hypothetical protein EBAPG3_007070 [Nitrosospira lacus]|uniref:Uncharacterized protein n=1 Tax=Nitrosospira lacus TaxID=1288494 RepID=A0A1W6SP04_9PROT|nr:hypothetical protein [Nitrosospira lacus]ARO87548.1 hypothetical protein EBAPG3_007070 [Nitrosospira lacus]